MNMPSFTEDEKLLINSGLSMVGGVLVGTVQGTYQYLTSGGNVSLNGAITFALGGFLALMGVALRAYVPAHAQQMLADAEARATQLEEALHLATTAQPAVIPSISQAPVAAPASPVTIHISSGGTVTSVIPETTTTPTLASVTQSVNSTPAPVQLTMAAPTIASTPDLASEDTAVRKSVTIVS